MSKAIKGNAGRKPPEPSVNPSDIDDWCRRLVPDLQPIVQQLDELIRASPTPARNDRPDPVLQGDQPGGRAATGAAEVDRASGTDARLDVMGIPPK